MQRMVDSQFFNDTLSHMQTSPSHKISKERTKFEGHLRKAGLKNSSGRRYIFEKIMNTHGHFTAEDLVKIFQKNKNHVSRATIYRSLKELLEAGVIRKTAFGEKHDCYEHIYDEKPHHHARCIRCHSLVEFPDLKEDKIYQPILEKHGFHILGHEMHFYGICQLCQNEKV